MSAGTAAWHRLPFASTSITRSQSFNATTMAVGLSAVLAIVGVLARPLIPVDETRYMAVAWEMYHTHKWLVPHLNGEPYSHKPPLLFWMVNAIWAVIGPAETAARLVPAAFFPVTVWLASVLGRLIGGTGLGDRAAIITASSLVFTLSSTLMMFDAVLTAEVLSALIGLVLASRGRRWTGFWLMGAMIGLGVLTKGPVVLIHVLPAAILAPLWIQQKGRWVGWYGGVLAALVLGAAIALGWAIPAAQAGGPAYGQMIFWGQTAGRVVDAFDHARPAWFYLVLAPALILPWSVSANLWRLVLRRDVPSETSDPPGKRLLRLPLVAAAGTFLICSLLSGKQIHYLEPIYPLLALSLAGILSRRAAVAEPGFAVLTFVFGLVLLLINPLHILPVASSPFTFAVGGFLAMGLSIGVWRLRADPALAALAATTSMFIALHASAALGGLAVYDASWASAWLAKRSMQAPVAFVGQYAGEFSYAARLTRPVEEIEPEVATAWLTKHPGGVLLYRYHGEAKIKVKPVERHLYRGGMLGVWVAPLAGFDPADHAPVAR